MSKKSTEININTFGGACFFGIVLTIVVIPFQLYEIIINQLLSVFN